MKSKFELYLLALLWQPGIGSATIRRIVNNTITDQKYSHWLSNNIIDHNEFKEWISSLNVKLHRDSCENAIYTALEKLNNYNSRKIEVLTFLDSKYSKRMLDMPDYPVLLYVKGNLELLNHSNNVAIIGTREPTEFGKNIGYRASLLLAQQGVNIVSGLAKGCDTIAHLGAVDAGGKTTAVLAHGLDTVYPKVNAKLVEKILVNDGLLLSEYPPTTLPRGHLFVERDRIQAGLSDSIVVVETGVLGGTMHTVKYAVGYNRKVYTLAHPDFMSGHEKVKRLNFLESNGVASCINSPEKLFSLVKNDSFNKGEFDYMPQSSSSHEGNMLGVIEQEEASSILADSLGNIYIPFVEDESIGSIKKVKKAKKAHRGKKGGEGNVVKRKRVKTPLKK